MSRTSYLDVKAVILGQIRSGELAPGDTVPGEAALLTIVSRGLVETQEWDFGRR